MIDWTQILIAVVGLLFTGVLIPLVKAGFDWLKSKTKNEAILAAMTEAQMVADTVVYSLQQTVVGGLKEKSADGRLTAEEAKEVAALAVDNFLNDISDKTLELISNNTDNIEGYVTNLIEARLARLKF